MRWEVAITAAQYISEQSRLEASALTYQYLNGGPNLLREREQHLRQIVSSLPEDAGIPEELRRDLMVWVTATAIAQRRAVLDLPPNWSTAIPEAR
jgi:hypothetical protein